MSTKPRNQEDQRHSRKSSSSSSSSTNSQASSSGSQHRKGDDYNPLSLHPPLSINTSPHIEPEYDVARYQEDEERESRFFNQTGHAEDRIRNLAEYSHNKGKNCIFEGTEAKPYVFDRASKQWPLKDWEPLPPGLSEASSSNASTVSSPTRPTASGRRNTDWMDDRDVFVKRGSWKRQGIVFHLDEDDQDLQEQHFELPE
jgi:hypothetical protein